MSSASVSVLIQESSMVGEARRSAVSLASEIGLDETERGQVAIAVTEAATNIVRHADGKGQIVLRRLDAAVDGMDGIEMLALDSGPGLANIENALRDGYSTGGSAGEGLGAIRRLSTVFDLYTDARSGTAILARFLTRSSRDAAKDASSAPWPDFGVVSLPVAGETKCGDSWGVGLGTELEGRAPRYIVADGLGHGPRAAEASQAAIRVFGESGSIRSPKTLLEEAHKTLRGTRGAAAAVVFVVPPSAGSEDTAVLFSGVGNIMSVLVTPETSRNLVSYNGTIGDQVARFQEFAYPCGSEVTWLILASDGLTTRIRLDAYPGIWGKHPALMAGILYRDFHRGRDDATVLVARIDSARPPKIESTARS